MRVELALFDGDTLLDRGQILVGPESSCDHFKLFRVAHQIKGAAAQVVLLGFSPSINLTTADLNMPIHQSADWESIKLAGYTLAFRCSLDA
jgi:hypothetical protein